MEEEEPCSHCWWCYRPSSEAVEMTAYMVMVHVLRSEPGLAVESVKWLDRQRNSQGGFVSTQDNSLSTARRSSGWSRTWTSLWRGRDRRDSVITHPCPGCHSGCEGPKLENICHQISAQVKGYHRWKPDYPRPRQEDPSSPCLATNQILFKTERDQDQDIVYL